MEQRAACIRCLHQVPAPTSAGVKGSEREKPEAELEFVGINLTWEG